MSGPRVAGQVRRIWNDSRLDSRNRHTIKFGIDLGLWMVAIPLAFWLRVEEQWFSHSSGMMLYALISVPVKVFFIYYFKLYWRSWHKLGLRDLLALGGAIGGAALVLHLIVWAGALGVPQSIPLIDAMIALFMLGGIRLATRVAFEEAGRQVAVHAHRSKRVLIVGAGEAGTMLAREMLRNSHAGLMPIGYLDDDPVKHNRRYVGITVLGPIELLPKVIEECSIDEVLIAMPSESGDVVRRVVDLAREARVDHRIIPGMYELLSGKVSISQIREVDFEDLLRREPVSLDSSRISSLVDGRVVLVTGAGGSIGSEIVRQLARFEPDTLVLLDRDEGSAYSIDVEMRGRHPDIRRHTVIADVCDEQLLGHVFQQFRPEVVFHAAAYKHVPLMELHPWNAVLNNIHGTRCLARLALKYDVKRLVNISTDKAVNPTSVMGASKRVAEMVVYAISSKCGPDQAFVSVRFGNVLGSKGSVVPLFKKQIRDGGPVTVTHPEMTRYFMTIPEASQLVLQAGSLAGNGNVYVLDMGQPVKIVDLAKDLIMLSGLSVGRDVEITFTGVRPGEKLYEELLTDVEGATASSHEKIFIAKNGEEVDTRLDGLVDQMVAAALNHDEQEIRRVLAELIPGNHLSNGANISRTD